MKSLIDSNDLSVELKRDMSSYMVLKGTYGEKIHRTFGMTRQGVRWRFQRVLGDMYVSAFETILFIEKIFGTQLRDYAMKISKERYELRQKALANRFKSATVCSNK